MTELRIILLVIGIAVIALIYIWETLKQKRNLRSRIDNYHAPARSVHRVVPVAPADGDGEREMADFNLFLRQNDAPAHIKTDPHKKSLSAAKENMVLQGEPGPVVDNHKPGTTIEQEIIVLYITAHKQPCFKGADILKAMKAAAMEYGDMRIFHYPGPDRKHARRPLFSVANISEPGYFVMEDMQTFTTKGLALFLCLPAEMGGDIAFEFMLEAAQTLATSLGGELRGADRKPLDENAIDQLRVIASLY